MALLKRLTLTSRFGPVFQHSKDTFRLFQILGPRIAFQFLKHSKETRLAFRADGEDWPMLAERAPHIAVPLSNASVAAGCATGLGLFDAFVCAQGTIIVDKTADLLTVYFPKRNDGNPTTPQTVERTEDNVYLLDIDNQFSTGDPCALEKTAAAYFGHVLFLAASPSPRGLKFLVHTRKGTCATLTSQQLSNFMDIWSRRDGRFILKDEVWEQGFEEDRSSMDTLTSHVGCGEEGNWDKESLLDEEEVPFMQKIEIWVTRTVTVS